MPIETNFYSTLQAPDIAGGIQQGLKMSQLAKQNKLQDQEIADKQAVRDAYKGNLTQDANGNMVLNKGGYLSQLAKVNPQMAFEHQKMIAQNERDAQAAQIQAQKDHMSLLGQKLNGITDQSSYDAAKTDALNNGWAKPGELPDVYDPNHIKQLQAQTMDAHTYLDQQMKQLGIDNEQKKTGIEGRKADIEAGKLQLEREKAFGKDQGPAAPVTPDTDPAVLVRGKVPEKDREKAFAELKDIQNVAYVAPRAMEAFQQAAKEARPLTGGTGTSISALNPWGDYTPAQKKFLGLINTTVKEAEGTSRAAAFQSIKDNFLPVTGDSDAKVKAKMEGLNGYLQSHAASPVLKGYGIDPTQFNNSNVDRAVAKYNSDRPQDPAALPIPADQVTDKHVADAQAELARRAAAKNQARR